ncbi:MAG: glycosyltransferase family 2 protein [bacterium]|nr:glycosyltransferase family 2 protein [bacterium]
MNSLNEPGKASMIEVSIIIPFQRESDYLIESLQWIGKLENRQFEVILLPDQPIDPGFLAAHVPTSVAYAEVVTGPVSPAIKRDLGAQQAQGAVLAFIDDDAYPQPDWLDQALPHFEDPRVCGVGGPQVTPANDNFWQKVSGATFLSPLNGSAVMRYYPYKEVVEVDDWPSVNLLVRKSDFVTVGGFDNAFWPGEDTKLCAELVGLGKKILYEGRAVVFHHRRSGFRRHMRQIGNYGEHRGYFVKILPQTSLRLSYMLPSGFFMFVLFGWLSCFAPPPGPQLYFFGWVLYGLAILIHLIGVWQKAGSLVISLATTPYLLGTHFVYGYRFLKGLLSGRDFTSKLGR